jgi:AcrR family transcriptional regulator
MDNSSNDVRRKLLHQATEMFASRGYAGFSIAALCREIGIANGTFYLYFQNKDDIFSAVVTGAVQTLAGKLRDPQRMLLSPRQREVFDVSAMVDFIKEHQNLFHILLSEHNLRQQERDSLMDLFAQQRAIELKEGVAKGVFRYDLNADIVAYAEIGFVNELLQWWMRRPGICTREQLIHHLLAVRSRLLFPDTPELAKLPQNETA